MFCDTPHLYRRYPRGEDAGGEPLPTGRGHALCDDALRHPVLRAAIGRIYASYY